jgi:hypothetical protein
MALLVAAAGLAHVPVTAEHLREAPYVALSFLAFAIVGVVLAVVIWLRPSSTAVTTAGAVCAAAVLTYAATRLVAFPQIGDDVGNWLEPWGVVSVALESLAVVVSVLSRRGGAGASRRAPRATAAAPAGPQRAAA